MLTSELSLFELLVGEASEADLLKAIGSMRRRSADDEDAVERISEAALALHRSRAEDRRRAVGLTVLADTAFDLAAGREVDELLAEICRRARMLLGTDVAYITLSDAQDTYVRATDGIVSDAFRAMRIPLGTGLGGLVARTGQPAFTVDYPSDSRLEHDASIDQHVAQEKLRSIAAAPLRRGDEILGVVMSGSRTVRRFEPQELAMLSSLAAHAAIAIENANLLQTSRQALEELAAANDALHRQTEHLHRVAGIHEKLAACALSGATPDELLATLAALLPADLELRDHDGTLLASAGTAEVAVELQNVWEEPVMAAADQLGTVFMRRSRVDGFEREVLARASVLMAAVLLAGHAQSEAEQRHLSRLLENVLEGDVGSDQDARRLLSQIGVRSNDEFVVLAATPAASAERWAWIRAARAAAAEQGMVGTVAGSLVIIASGDDPEELASRWAKHIRGPDREPATIGAALCPADNLQALRSTYREASGVLRLLIALGRQGSWATAERLGIFGHMFVHQTPTDLRAFIERSLGPVIQHEEGSAHPLLDTLEAYFACAGHLANTARALDCHINTLYGRLERLSTLLGVDWQAPDRRLELHLAVRLHAVDGELSHGDQSLRRDSPA